MTRTSLLIIGVALFMSFLRLGSVTLFDVDEAVFAEASKEMVRSGDWITPTYNGEVRYDKPILFYWLMSASYTLFGENEFAARFPSALAAFSLVLAVFFFVRYFRGERYALYAAITLTISGYFFAYSHAAVTDMALTLLITLSLLSFYLSVSLGKKGWYVYGFYLFSSLAFLTKGLIGIIFPFGIATVYLFITGGPAGVKRAFSLKGIIIFLLVSFPWYVSQTVIHGQEFIRQFFIKHHFMRYTGVISGHRGPVYYFIPALGAGLFPWVVFLPAGIRNAFKDSDGLSVTGNEVRNKKESGNPSLAAEKVARHPSLNLFALVWFAFIFIFFSLSTTKLPNYILPAIPAASLLIASGMTVEDKRGKQYSNGFLAVLSALMGLGFMISRRYLLKIDIHSLNWTAAVALTMFAMAGLGFYAVFKRKQVYGIMSALMIIFLVILSTKALPVANQYLQGTLYSYSLYAKERLHSGERIITYGINNPSIVFYSGRNIIKANSKDELLTLVGNNGHTIVIMKTKDSGILEGSGAHLHAEDGKYAIFEKP